MAINVKSSLLAAFVILLTSVHGSDRNSTSKSSLGSTKRFPVKVNNFIKNYCVSCHGPKKKKGGVRLDNISQDLMVSGSHADDWHEVLDALNKGEMPPEDEKQPGDAELTEVIELLTTEFVKATEKRRSTGGKVVMRRLTNYEYNNTLNELLALDENFSKDFPPDASSKDDFQNNGFVNAISEMQLNNYLEAARFAVDKAVQFKRPKLEMVHIQDKQALTGNGKGMQLKSKKRESRVHGLSFKGGGRRTTIGWYEFPREGKVAIDVEVENVTDLKAVSVEVGRRGAARHSTIMKKVNPGKATKKGNKILIRYLIEDMRVYPMPGVGENARPLLIQILTPKKANLLSAKVQGPVNEIWPPQSTRQIFIPSRNEKNENLYAKEIIESFMTRAWRRSVTKQEVDFYFKAYQKFRKYDNFVNSIKEFAVSILMAPDFLYLVESKSVKDKRERLTSHELSTRLSYFLWANMPDEQLLTLSKSGKIKDEATMRAQVKRMLQDEKSWKFVKNFTSQWLGLDRMSTVAVSPELYPGVEESIKEDMKEESYHFMAHLLRENKSALNIIDADFSFSNSRLTNHYRGRGAPKVSRNQLFPASPEKFKKVSSSKNEDGGGILTHAAVHLAYSNGEESHPIARGVWFVDKILGNPPPAPPEDVEFDKEIEGFNKLSLKQQLAVHVEKKACARCHMKIDPFGVAFEHYDVVGRYRQKVKKIDQDIVAQRRKEDSMRMTAEEIYKLMDKNSDKYINKAEYMTYYTKTNPGNNKKEDLEKKFVKLTTHHKNDGYPGPKGTFNLDKFSKEVNNALRKQLRRRKTPFRYIDVDAKVTLPDGTNINGLKDLKAYILKSRKNDFAENLIRRLLSYGLGRSLEFHDTPVVKQLTEKFKASDYKMGTLIEEIALCDLFQMK